MQYPRKFPRYALATVALQWERVNLRGGGEADTLTGPYVMPLGGSKPKLTFKPPVARNDVLGRGGYDIGDMSVGLSHVYELDESSVQISF